MWETSEIKERGRAAFRLNYWKCVLVSFIMGFVVSGPSSVTSRISVNNENSQQAFQDLANAYNNLSSGEQFAVIADQIRLYTCNKELHANHQKRCAQDQRLNVAAARAG